MKRKFLFGWFVYYIFGIAIYKAIAAIFWKSDSYVYPIEQSFKNRVLAQSKAEKIYLKPK